MIFKYGFTGVAILFYVICSLIVKDAVLDITFSSLS